MTAADAGGQNLRAPFPWFGGKSRVAGEVWEALGDVDHYVEPFFGSGAVLLGRPSTHRGSVETVNDLDGFVANFWRALAADPEAVAHHADWPVSEVDLTARHVWLVENWHGRLQQLLADPEWFDAKVAGWWVWGQSCWIAGGWCSGRGPWGTNDDGTALEHVNGRGVRRKLPHLGDAGRGVKRQLPHLGDAGRGVKRKLPHLGDARGVNRQHGGLVGYLAALAARLEGARVCCGDWARVVTRGALTHPVGGTVGVFLDPPYLGDVRVRDLYSTDDHTVSDDVREWCLANGDDPRLRIVLAGYAPEHDHLMPDSWRRIEWTASGSYSTATSAARQDGNHHNRTLERLWLSPHCALPRHETLSLFG